jgi:hypothetical protein
MEKRKKAPYIEEKAKSTKTNIHISSEYHQEKAGYPRMRRKRKCRAMQDPQDRLRISQHQIMLNERAIQARRESSRESKVTLRKYQTSFARKMTFTLKATKSRETRPGRPRSPQDHLATPRIALFFRSSLHILQGTRIFDDLSFDMTNLHS